MCNNVASAASAAYSSTEGDLYATSDESLYTSATEEDSTTATTATTTMTKSSMDQAINKIVTEIQSIATNDSLNGELEPLKPRKQPKKFNPMAEKKLKQFRKAEKTVSQAERSLTTDRTDPTETLPHIKRMRPEDYKRIDLEANAEAHSREERVRRETLNIPLSTGATATEEGNAAITTTAMEEGTLFIANYTEDSLSSSSATTSSSGVDGNLDWNNGDENVTQEEDAELSAASESAKTETLQLSSTVPSETLPTMIEISGTPHSAQPKGSITHPMHISSDMTKELLETPPPAVQEQPPTKSKKDKERAMMANQQDHFVPPMLLVKAKFTPGKQHIDAQENLTTFDGVPAEIQHTIESPIMETTNDISKFYPASTEKAMIPENKMLVEIPEPAANINTTSVAPTAALVPKKGYQSSTEAASTMTVLTSSASTPADAITGTTESPVTISTTTQEAETKEAPRSEFSFTNIENYQPYRPNRRRSLTKPASRSYLRRILG